MMSEVRLTSRRLRFAYVWLMIILMMMMVTDKRGVTSGITEQEAASSWLGWLSTADDGDSQQNSVTETQSLAVARHVLLSSADRQRRRSAVSSWQTVIITSSSAAVFALVIVVAVVCKLRKLYADNSAMYKQWFRT